MRSTDAAQRSALAVLCLTCAAFVSGCRPEAETPGGGSAAPRDSSPGHPAAPAPRSRAEVKPTGTLPSFRMVGAESGFDFERYDDVRGRHLILESTGGGVGLFDYDRDGLLDAFLTNGCRLPLSLGDRETRGEFFRNQGGMTFENTTDESLVFQFGYTAGCAVGDYDADGFDDLYVTAFGRNALWRNNGDGTFTDATDATGTQVPKWSSSAAFADLDGDGDLDLYVVNYLEESDESPTLCPNPASPDGYEQCSPAMFEGVDDVLFLSDGKGGFTDATADAGIAGLRGKGLGVVISDLDGHGRPEIYVANDGDANFLFVARRDESRELRVERTGEPAADLSARDPRLSSLVYDERALVSSVALNEYGYAQAGMGIAAGDYDADGTTDLYLTHYYGDTNTLYANRGGLFFEEETRTSNLGPTSRQMLSWGTAFLDADNDGWLDLIVANGHVDDQTWSPQGQPYRMRPQMYRNGRDGTFTDVSDWSGDYFLDEWLGRGLAIGDLDRDGRIDAAVSHQLAPSVALRNETSTDDASLVLRLVGTSSNRNGYGARVELIDSEPTVIRELIGGGSFQSASAPEIHLGLGEARQASIRIRWPSGIVESYQDLEPGQYVAVERQGMHSQSSSATP